MFLNFLLFFVLLALLFVIFYYLNYSIDHLIFFPVFRFIFVLYIYLYLIVDLLFIYFFVYLIVYLFAYLFNYYSFWLSILLTFCCDQLIILQLEFSRKQDPSSVMWRSMVTVNKLTTLAVGKVKVFQLTGQKWEGWLTLIFLSLIFFVVKLNKNWP